MLQKLIIADGTESVEVATARPTATPTPSVQLHSIPHMGVDAQSGSTRECKEEDKDKDDETLHATNNVIRCPRCGYYDGEKANLLGEGHVEDQMIE